MSPIGVPPYWVETWVRDYGISPNKHHCYSLVMKNGEGGGIELGSEPTLAGMLRWLTAFDVMETSWSNPVGFEAEP
jgi:hypothetical protein